MRHSLALFFACMLSQSSTTGDKVQPPGVGGQPRAKPAAVEGNKASPVPRLRCFETVEAADNATSGIQYQLTWSTVPGGGLLAPSVSFAVSNDGAARFTRTELGGEVDCIGSVSMDLVHDIELALKSCPMGQMVQRGTRAGRQRAPLAKLMHVRLKARWGDGKNCEISLPERDWKKVKALSKVRISWERLRTEMCGPKCPSVNLHPRLD